MRKLICTAILAFAAAFAMPAFADNANIGINPCAAVDAEIEAAAIETGTFINSALTAEQQATIEQAITAIVASAEAQGLRDPSQLTGQAKGVFDALYVVFAAASDIEDAAQKALLVRYAMGDTCSDPALREELRTQLAGLKDPALRERFTTAANVLATLAANYNATNGG